MRSIRNTVTKARSFLMRKEEKLLESYTIRSLDRKAVLSSER